MSLRRKFITITPILLYWPAIFVISHIPIPRWVAPVGFSISDKTLHCFGYFILVFLLWMAVGQGRKVNWRKAGVWWVLFAVVWYGAIDEWLQGYVGRDCDVSDFFADLTGTVFGLILLSIFPFWPAALVLSGSTIFFLTNFIQANANDVLFTTSILFRLFCYALFTLSWIRYLRRLVPLEPPEFRWLIGVTALPVAFLILVEVFSVVAGNDPHLAGIAVSIVTIAIVIGVNYFVALIRRGPG